MLSVERFLLDLIRIPSASALTNRGVVEYAEDVLRSAGWGVSVDCYKDAAGVEKMNLVAAPSAQNPCEPAVDLAFLSHTDTVPPAVGWAGALEPYVDGGFIYGCGACDVKGFLACLLTAVVETSGEFLRPGLRVVLTADEEVGCLGAHRLLAAGKMRARALVIGEPTSLHPARAGKGYCLGEVTVYGAEAHSAHPLQGRSAIYDAARFIQAIEVLAVQLAEEQNSFFDPPYTTINVGTIRGGTAKNIVPGECSFLVEWRPVPGQLEGGVPEAIARIGESLVQADSKYSYDFKILRQQPGFETSSGSALVQAMERLTGRGAISIPFGSEASIFAPLVEEIVVFGAGDMRTAHSPRECVPVPELLEAVGCIKALMQDESLLWRSDKPDGKCGSMGDGVRA